MCQEPNRFSSNKGYLLEVNGDSPLFGLDQSFQLRQTSVVNSTTQRKDDQISICGSLNL